MGEAVKCLVETAVCEIACTVVWEVRVVRPVLPDSFDNHHSISYDHVDATYNDHKQNAKIW